MVTEVVTRGDPSEEQCLGRRWTICWMGEPDLRRGDLPADEAKWWVPYAAEFVGTLLFQVFGGSTAVTMDAVFNGVGVPHTHAHMGRTNTCTCAHAHAPHAHAHTGCRENTAWTTINSWPLAVLTVIVFITSKASGGVVNPSVALMLFIVDDISWLKAAAPWSKRWS